MPYYSGQGKVYVGTRLSTGEAGPLKYLGNVPELTIKLETTVKDHIESTSGNRLTDQSIQTAKNGNVSFSLEDFTADNLAIILYGTKLSQTGAAVTNEPVGGVAVANNDYVRTKYPDISALTVKDSAGTPASLTLNTHYRIANARTGLIQILSIGTFVQPFMANYTYATHSHVPFFTTGQIERWLRFEGLNTADVDNNGNPRQVLVELYRVVADPVKDWGLIMDDMAKWTCDGKILYDTTKASDTYLGGFGRVVFLT